MEAFNAKLMSLSVAYALSCKVIKYIFTPENILVNRLSVNKTHVVHKTKWQVSSSAESTCKWTPWLAGKGLESTIHSEVEAPRDPQTHNPHWLRRFIQLRHVCCRSISIPRYITKNHIQTLNGSPKKEQVMWVKEERERERGFITTLQGYWLRTTGCCGAPWTLRRGIGTSEYSWALEHNLLD